MTASSPKRILVLYRSRWQFPLRNAIETHLYCWQNYSRHRVCYLNVAFGFPSGLIQSFKPDVVVFHTTFLSARWHPSQFQKFKERCADLRTLDCVKIAIPQDEFIHMDLVNEFIRDFGVTHLFTCASEPDWPTLYPNIDRDKVILKTVLTGYLDPIVQERIEALKPRSGPRDIDIGYRAWKAEYWLGEHGMHKVWVGDQFQCVAEGRPVKVDISLRAEDTLKGDDWFHFLLRSRATIGVEGGASVLDWDGSIRERVNAYLQANPEAGFEEVRKACFAEQEHGIALSCLSPRHLEACATETVQFLIEGNFNGILKAGKHYFPIKADYSNLEEAYAFLEEPEKMRAMTRAAYEDVVGSGRWTYEAFVKEQDDMLDAIPMPDSRVSGLASGLAALFLRWRDRILWQYIQLEVQSKPQAGEKPSAAIKWQHKLMRSVVKTFADLS